MTAFDERSVLSPRRRRLLALPLLLALAGVCLAATHRPQGWGQALRELRGDAPADPGPNRAMDTALQARHFLLTHPSSKLGAAQTARLVGLVTAPPDEQSQSEALDVLSLAQRMNALSGPQALDAQNATLRVLRQSPGPMVRLESARFLGHLGSAENSPALTLLQADPEPKVQAAARQALARIQRSQAHRSQAQKSQGQKSQGQKSHVGKN